MSKDLRLEKLTDWIHQDTPNATIEVASADASFRRYFRILEKNTDKHTSAIAMDAPPEQEDCTPFIDVTKRLRNAGVHAPKIIRQDLEQGFLLLEDFGNTPYLDVLNDQTADQLYGDALNALLKIQTANTDDLPEYNEAFLQQEMQLMPEWFLKTHLKITPTTEQQKIIDRTLSVITASVLQQPQVFVHRDYHSRNLMYLGDNTLDANLQNVEKEGGWQVKSTKNNPGIIDYQDAILGPITYDLVSLLRDCYIRWPNEKIAKWVLGFKEQAENAGLMNKVPDATFIQWFDYMGLQRHIKVLGIFARLNHRDGKTNYLNDLPLTLHYMMEVANKYPLTRPLVDLFNEWNIPTKINAKK
jgi:aminoglycoside/choline kinase family phosphotransferase